MKRKFLEYLKFNRYVYSIWNRKRHLNRFFRTIVVSVGSIGEMFKHGFALNDYYKEIKDNDFVMELDDCDVKLYIPSFEYDCIQSTIARDKSFYSVDELMLLREKGYIYGDVLDIGANIGNHTVFFAKMCDTTSVNSFEPQKEIYDILNKNIELNRLTNKCISHNLALGADEGYAKVVSSSEFNSGGFTLEMAEDGYAVCSLDSIGIPHADFIKIDVEGFEHNVLMGARNIIERDKPVIFVEIKPNNYKDVNCLLMEYGYSMVEKIGDENYIYRTN